MSNTAISVRNLTKTYKLYHQPIDRLKEALHPLKKSYHKNFNALDGVSFEINRGETVGIIGRNGSGKSTLLKLITGVLTPTSGRAIVHGRVSAILELGAGFNGEMTGLENIYLNNTINGIPESETKKRVQQIIDFAELGEFIHQPLKTYSSGMKARLAFAVAINVEPDILIVDEALSVGDAAFQRKCFAKMEQIRKAGATILFVSHSEASIVSLCSRAIWISNGQKVLDGTPKLVTSLYMKNSNVNKIDKSKIENEYERIDSSEEKKIEGNVTGSLKVENLNENARLQANQSSVNEFYDPLLKPKSTIYYEEKGARISGFQITTLRGKEVNVLLQDGFYKINMLLDVKNEIKNLRLGIRVKDIQGRSVSGCAYELKKHAGFLKTKKGRYEVCFLFKSIIIGGSFLFDVVATDLDSNELVLHRVNDAYMFKVKNNNALNLMQGKTSLFQECVINEVK